MATDVRKYMQINSTAKFPWISDELSVRFVDNLYKRGAITIEMTDSQYLGNRFLILGLFVVTNNENKRAVVNEILKANPAELTETKPNIFRVAWDPISLV
jgi:hypothetical protein